MFQFKEFDDSNLNDYSSLEINIENYNFNKNLKVNEMVKAFDKKLYYVASSNDNKILYIISIHNYEGIKFSQRIYKINIYDLYYFQFESDIRITVYKDFLALASNFHTIENGNIYSSVIIFSYSNSSNSFFEIDSYLLENNDIKINNLTFELNGECFIENNIFGYIKAGIKIFENCNEENDLYLASISNEKINSEYFLENSKKIKLIVPVNESYDLFKCQFTYACVVTEPDYEEYNNYTEEIFDTENDIISNEEQYFDPKSAR